LSFADHVPYFVSEITSLAHSRLPSGTEIVMVSPSQSLTAENLVPRAETPRIYLMDQEASAPNGRRLVDVFGGRTLTLDQFQTRVAQ
jgi:ATP-dependent DNA helicase RecQ